MKNILSFKLFIESVITDPKRLLEPKIKHFLEQIELYNCGKHIWTIKINDQQSRAMVFLRSQEYFESPFDKIVGKQFKISDYIDIYKEQNKKQEFSYGADWEGFNIPSTILEECMFNIPSDEMNNYDKIMLSIIATIKNHEKDRYYLLGVDTLDKTVLEHEFAHAMYFTIPEYKIEMDELTIKCENNIKKEISIILNNMGYIDQVFNDEFQSYMSTGLLELMLDIKNINTWEEKYREIFLKYYNKELYISPKEEIIWNFQK